MAFQRLGGMNWDALRKARSEKEVKEIIAEADSYYHDHYLAGREPTILKAIQDRRCSKTSEAFRRFLASALAGSEYGLSPRRSEVIRAKSLRWDPVENRWRWVWVNRAAVEAK
jgi:hypothetical protein